MTDLRPLAHLQPPSVLLMGPSGSGKTTSLATLLQAGLEVFVLITEPNGADSLLDATARLQQPVSRLHWHVTAPAAAGWRALTDMAKTVNTMSYEDIAKIKMGVGKMEQKQLEDLLHTLENFRDDRTGQQFGDVTSWGADRALVLDSLSGLNLIAMSHTIGYKPSAHQGEWGIAMNLEEQILLKLTSDCKCFFVLTAHLDRSMDEVTGGMRIGPAALGTKLAPRLSRFFSEVVLQQRKNDVFTWSTSDANTDVKNRALSIGSNLPPSFAPVVEAYRKRVASISASPAAETPPVVTAQGQTTTGNSGVKP